MTDNSRDDSAVQPAPGRRPIFISEITGLVREAVIANRERQECDALINLGEHSPLIEEALACHSENRRDYLNSLLDQLWDYVNGRAHS